MTPNSNQHCLAYTECCQLVSRTVLLGTLQLSEH